MKKTAKILAALLVLLMIVPAIVSCAKTNGGAPNGTEASSDDISGAPSSSSESQVITNTNGEENIETGITETFDGAKVNILYRGNTEQYGREWTADTDKPDTLQTAIFKRNADLQTKLGVTLNFIKNTEADSEMNNLITKDFKSGAGAYHIISNYAAFSGTTQNINGFINLRNDRLYNMDLEKGYWNQNYIEEATAYDKTFLAVGDVNLSVYDRCHVVFFNKAEAAERLGNFDELYQMVLDGEWTLDVFYEMIADIHEDNGTTDTGDDFYGVASIKGSECYDGFLYALGGKLTQDNGEGKRVIVSDTNFTKLSNLFDRVAEFWAADGAIGLKDSKINYDFFTGGQSLFDIDVVYHYASGLEKLKNMEDGFGVLPMPKLDTDQAEYTTGVQDAHCTLAVPFHMSFDYGMISAVLETFNKLSYDNVRPLYIEKIVKGQTLDKNSAEVFDICIKGARWDFADVYAQATGGIRNKIWRGPLGTLLSKPGSTDFTQAYTKNETAITESLDAMDTFLSQVD